MFFIPYDNCKVLYLYRFIVTLRFSSNAFRSLLICECTFFFINETLEIRFFEKTPNLSGSIFVMKWEQIFYFGKAHFLLQMKLFWRNWYQSLSESVFFIKCWQNHRAPAMSYECYNVDKNDIDLKTKNRQKTQREQS